MEKEKTILEVNNLKTQFFTESGIVRAVDGVSFHVNRGEVLGIVGESGCGKSVTSLSIMGLVADPGKIVDGSVNFDGQDLSKMTQSELSDIRGNRISMIFQQPQSSLNPVFRVGDQITEVLHVHQNMDRAAAESRAIELLSLVGIPSPEERYRSWPHEMSGGMAQRVMIAMALACVPELLIADEPTTALDVTIQAQILDLIRDLKEQMDTAVILITHDLGVVAELCDRVVVMYAGRVVETADIYELFENPKHPYTASLIGATPVLGEVDRELVSIPGSVPNLINLPTGCKFAPRCVARIENNLDICNEEDPELRTISEGHDVRCWLYDKPNGSKNGEAGS